MKLKTTDIINPIHPNRSTALFGGVSSGILNWNDIRYPSIYDKRERLRATFWSAGEINFSNDYVTSQEEEMLHRKAQLAQERMTIAQAIADVASDASVTSVLSTVIDQLGEQILTVSHVTQSLKTVNVPYSPIEDVEGLYEAMVDFIQRVNYDEQANGKGVSEFLGRAKQDDSLHVDFFLTVAPIVEEETGVKTGDSEWLREYAKTHEVYLMEEISTDEEVTGGSTSFHGFDDL